MLLRTCCCSCETVCRGLGLRVDSDLLEIVVVQIQGLRSFPMWFDLGLHQQGVNVEEISCMPCSFHTILLRLLFIRLENRDFEQLLGLFFVHTDSYHGFSLGHVSVHHSRSPHQHRLQTLLKGISII